MIPANVDLFFFFPTMEDELSYLRNSLLLFPDAQARGLPCTVMGGTAVGAGVSSAWCLASPAALHCAPGPVGEMGVSEMHRAIKHRRGGLRTHAINL